MMRQMFTPQACRDVRDARRMTVVVLLVVATSLLVSGVIDLLGGGRWVWIASLDTQDGSIATSIVMPLACLVTAYCTRYMPDSQIAFLVWSCCILGSAGVAATATTLQDTGVTGQAYFVVCIIAGAYALRTHFAWLNYTIVTVTHGLVLMSISAGVVGFSDWLTTALLSAGVVLMICHLRDRDIQARARLHQLATVDSLTGLYRRGRLDSELDAPSPASVAGPGAALLLIDVDRFKDINDAYGHLAGDHVLRLIAIAAAEAAGGTGYATRLGGDEMAVYWPTIDLPTAQSQAQTLLRIMDGVRAEADDGTTFSIGVSLGLAHWPTHTADRAELYRFADDALYASKSDAQHRFYVAGRGGEPAAAADAAAQGLAQATSPAFGGAQ